MKRFISLVTIGLGLLYWLGTNAPIALAASTSANSSPVSSGQALQIAPPILTLTANPGQTIKPQIELRDISSANMLVTNEINDFIAQGENGTPKILMGNNYSDPFSIKNWIKPLPSFTLTSQQIQTLTLDINVPANASPGGHYGVIRFTGTPAQMQTTGVSLTASLGTLVLLTVNGKLNDNLAVQQFSAADSSNNPGWFFESAPVNFIVRTKNMGNVQEEPTGHIAITDMFGKLISDVIINIPPRDVLPDSIREFIGTLGSTTIGNKALFGRYHAELSLSYGVASSKTLKADLTFWVIPYKLIAVISVLVIVAFFLLRFLIKRYNRIIVSKARPRR